MARPNPPAPAPVPTVVMRGVAINSRHDPTMEVAAEVNWTVNPGEFWVVAGGQRSGKSDLLMLAGGLACPARGTYEFLGERMPIYEDERLPHRRKLSFIFENGQLFNQMTIAENVALPLRYHENLDVAGAAPRVRETLELLRLTKFAHRRPAGVARNWQLRASLARGLILKPALLLLDNPLGGLDARHAAWWLIFLEQLRVGHSFMDSRPVTIVMTTDDLPRVAAGLPPHCRFAVMSEERLQVVGDREALFASRAPWVAELLTAAETIRPD